MMKMKGAEAKLGVDSYPKKGKTNRSQPPPPPRWGGMVLATSKKTQDKELKLGAYPP